MPQTSGHARFDVLLPSAEEPVTYDIDFYSYTSVDSLAPCQYLIDWKMEREAGSTEGFSAYFDGNHYRYRDGRLQEYHFDRDSVSFMPTVYGVANKQHGVQNQAQFASLLPHFIGRQLSEMLNDSTYTLSYIPDTIIGGRHVTVVKGMQRAHGYDCLEFEYIFDPTTVLPIRTESVNNPGSISEQIVTVEYSDWQTSLPFEVPLTEDALLEIYPKPFELFRQSNYRIENLVGHPLPSFSAPTLTGERHSYTKGETLVAPTIIVFLDTTVGTTAQAVSDIRAAVAQLPMNCDILWAFGNNNRDEIEQIVGHGGRIGEYVLVSARSLNRSCGVSTTPTIAIVGIDGIIKDVIVGYNNNLPEIVIQKTIIANNP